MASLIPEMASHSILTNVHLPPGVPSTATVRDLLRFAFEECRWFQPAPDGLFEEDEDLDHGRISYSARIAHYDEVHSLCITDQKEQQYLMISTSSRTDFPFVGRITWCVSVDDPSTSGWLDTHLRQVLEVMRRVGSYLAQSGVYEDAQRKKQRFISLPDGFGTEQTSTLRDPSEGLTGLYWRNIFGPPFVRMFGDRLLFLPPSTVEDLGDGLVMVQPYELPTQAMTPEGDAAEERLITVLGPECFYDHARHRKPTRVPELTPPST